MTKGQHGNKEAKKPKKDKPVAAVAVGAKVAGLPAPVAPSRALHSKKA